MLRKAAYIGQEQKERSIPEKVERKHKKQTSFCCCRYPGFHALGDHKATDR